MWLEYRKKILSAVYNSNNFTVRKMFDVKLHINISVVINNQGWLIIVRPTFQIISQAFVYIYLSLKDSRVSLFLTPVVIQNNFWR